MKNLKIVFILILFFQLSFAQNRIVYGSVTDSTGLPFAGLNVQIEGTAIITNVDFNGCFSIKANPDQFLVFSFIGVFPQRISASKDNIDVVIREDHSHDRDCIAPSFPIKKEKIRCAATSVSAEDIKNINNPKYNFKQNLHNIPLIFVSDYNLKKTDLDFQTKYKINYYSAQNYSIEYVKTYNKLTFKYLKKKYNKVWQSEIKKDAIGLNEF